MTIFAVEVNLKEISKHLTYQFLKNPELIFQYRIYNLLWENKCPLLKTKWIYKIIGVLGYGNLEIHANNLMLKRSILVQFRFSNIHHLRTEANWFNVNNYNVHCWASLRQKIGHHFNLSRALIYYWANNMQLLMYKFQFMQKLL